MTRRQYEIVARSIARQIVRADDDDPQMIVAADLVEDLADVFEAGNPRFDRDRFAAACGIDAEDDR
jgi:hypothetical protein